MMDALDADRATATVADVPMFPRSGGTTVDPQSNRGSDMRTASKAEAGGVFAAFCRTAGFAAADLLCLAAAPTFAMMAVLTGALGSDTPHLLCSAALGMPPLSGMVPMYSLMSLFHTVPWLKLLLSQLGCPGRS